MAVPKKIRNKNIDRLKFVESAADSFDANIETIQDTIFRNIVSLIKDLDTKGGRIKQSSGNLKKVLRARTVRNLIVTPAYKKSVESFVNKFDAVRDKNNSYFKSLPDGV